ncbi:MAG: T9SS type A sorting domain-containing protein [Lewinellaceae bacterium]|nr:T9SS type A sorting domain-containing protein [Lewinellaceae bacterium]
MPDPLVIATYTLNNTTNPGQFTLGTFPGNNFWDRDTLGRYGNTPCLPIGTHVVRYMAEDVCGNTSSCTFDLTVVDDVPPVASCTQFTTVAIGTDDPTDCYDPTGACKFGGVTWVAASAFNQGSYDNCNGIDFTIRRMGPYSQCIQDLKTVSGCDNWRVDACGELDYNEGNGFNDEYDIATAENDSIKFYCCEVGTTQMIILRVYQLDINGNWAYYTDELGLPMRDPETGCIMYIFNECMIEVEVQDKIKPVCQPPAHVTVSCENFDPSLWAYGYPSVSDNCCLDDTPPTSALPGGVANIPAGTTAVPGVCGATQKTYYNGFLNAGFDTTCNRGIIIRRFTAWDCYGFSSSCTQRITVTSVPDYNIVFPADDTENCVGVPDFGYPQITNDEGCELIGVAYNDVYFTVVPDACYKIERTWTVINWCDYDPDAACYEQLRANGRSVRVWNNPAIAGDETPNCVTYKQIIKVIDQTPPTITCAPIDTCDYSSNFDSDGLRYWNDGDLWWDNGTQSHNLCESDKTLLSVSAEDFCDSISPVGGLRFRYLLFLDLDADGIMETVVSSADANTTRPGGFYGRVRYNNYQNLNYGGGGASSVRRFDLSANPYAFNIEQTLTGARVTWRTAGGSVQNPNLPHGRHKIKWIAEDGCGNEAVCEQIFTIRDCKAPTVACADVNINLMFGGMATLWASDFFLYAEDNCTPADILKVAVIRADDTDYDHNSFPTDASQSVVVTCDDEGTEVDIEVWVIDAAGRADFCTAKVNVQANLVGCDGTVPTATVAGALATENVQNIDEVSVAFNVAPSANVMQIVDGSYSFTSVPMGSNVTVTPAKDNDPLNGVTTYDLVLISKHILGLEPLTTPYKMIAADANRSGSITTFDIVEFRKLILGIYEELPTNTSWRFVDKAYSFPEPTNPFQSVFPENMSINNLAASYMNGDFVGVKIGDVNNSVIANELQSVEDRTANTLVFDVAAASQSVTAGEEVVVNFKATDKMMGYQFTMNFDGLEVVEVLPGANMSTDNFGVFADAITTSAEGNATEFAVKFRAVASGDLSRMLAVSSRITKAEAYTDGGQRNEVAFRFEGANGPVIGAGFELFQNQPNPVVGKTNISFNLPESAEATLKITNVEGRIVKVVKGAFSKGLNTVTLNRAELESGMLFYELSTAKNSAVKKMIIVD